MVHYPKRRRWFGALPDRCACGGARFDRCPDAVADAQAGVGAPRGRGYPDLIERKREDMRSNRSGYRWTS